MYIWFVEYLLILFLSRILIWLKNYVSWNKLELLITNSLNIFSPLPFNYILPHKHNVPSTMIIRMK